MMVNAVTGAPTLKYSQSERHSLRLRTLGDNEIGD